MAIDVKHKRSVPKVHVHTFTYRAQSHSGKHPSNEFQVTKGAAEGCAIFGEEGVVFNEVHAAPDNIARREGGSVGNPCATLVVHIPVVGVVAIGHQLPSCERMKVKERR